MAKKFGESVLNSIQHVDDTITKAIEDNTQELRPVQPEQPATPSVPESTTTAEQLAVLEAPVENDPVRSRVGGSKTRKTPKKPTKDEEQELEKTIGLNLPIPKSLYKRMSNMKFDRDGESLKSIGLAAIETYLKKEGY